MSATLVLARLPEGPEIAALVEDRHLADLFAGPAMGPEPEAIHKARITRLMPGAGAAIVDLGEGHSGWLREAKGMKEGQTLLVEVSSVPEPGKAVPVSARVLYRQRLTIHTPGAPGINPARSLRDAEERARLTGLIEAELERHQSWLDATPDVDDAGRVKQVLACHRTGGTIIRSAAAGASALQLTRDLHLATAARIDAEEALADPSTPPGVVLPAPLPRDRALRDWGDRVSRIVLGAGDFSTLILLEKHRGSAFTKMIEEFGKGDPLDHYGVLDALDGLRTARADLPSGGWISVEPTRALTAIDVNTGEATDPGAAMTANVETVRDLPRQLRLRGIGGQVVIDFAPMKKMHRQKIEEELKRAFARDPIATTLAGWTPLGNFELQRKRERIPLADLLGPA